MADHSSALHGDGEDLLASALSDAFSPVDLPRQSVTPSETPLSLSLASLHSSEAESPPEPYLEPESLPPPEQQTPPEHATDAELEAWKKEYEAQLTIWRKENAERREKARQEREKWEKKREREKAEMDKLKEEMAKNGHSLDWAKLDAGSSGAASPVVNVESREELAKKAEEAMKIVQDRVEKGETSVVDGRALVPGEAEGKHSLEFIERALPRVGPVHATVAIQTTDLEPSTGPEEQAHAQDPSHGSSSPHWEDVPSSMNSSFPSMSFPEASRAHSETPSQPNNHSHSHHHEHPPHSQTQHKDQHHDSKRATTQTPSATLAIFDNTLSTRTRAWALVSALAINMFLPFVNGVMLGFGELVAKEIIAPWFGWKPAGMRVGLSGSGGAQERRARNATKERTGKEL